MDIWNYYDGDLKYPNIFDHLHEKEIAKSNYKLAYWYACKHGVFPEGETEIAKNTLTSFCYANDVLNNRFYLGEPVIAKDSRLSYEYARHIIKGKFKRGEKA